MQDVLSSEEQMTNKLTTDAVREAHSSTSGDAALNGPTPSSSTRSRRTVRRPSISVTPRSSSVSIRRRYEPKGRLNALLTDVQGAIQQHGQRLMLRDYLDAVRFEWQEVALIVDRTLLLTFVLVTFCATAVILLQAPLSTQFLFGN